MLFNFHQIKLLIRPFFGLLRLKEQHNTRFLYCINRQGLPLPCRQCKASVISNQVMNLHFFVNFFFFGKRKTIWKNIVITIKADILLNASINGWLAHCTLKEMSENLFQYSNKKKILLLPYSEYKETANGRKSHPYRS